MSKKEQEFSLKRSNFGVKGWLVLLFSFICILVQSSIINDQLNVTIEAFSGEKGWNISSLYLFSTIAAWISVFGAALWGIISHKVSIRFAWALSLAVTSISCFFWGRAQSPTIYFICLAFASVGGMGFAYIANLNVVSNWFPRKKGLAMGWVTIGFPVSAMITVPLVSGILGAKGLPGVFTFYGIVTLVLCIICALFIRDYPEQAGALPDNDKSFSKEEAERQFNAGLEYMKKSPWTVKKIFSNKTAWQIGISLGFMELIALGIMTNFFPRCAQAGYAEQEIIVMLAIAGGVACFGSYLCGILDAEKGPKKAIIITLVIAIIAIVLNIIPTKVTMYSSLLFLGILLGGAANYLVSIINTVWGRYDFPLVYKVVKPIVAIVGALGITIVGVIGNTVSYVAAYIVLCVLAVISLIIMFFVDDKRLGKDL